MDGAPTFPEDSRSLGPFVEVFHEALSHFQERRRTVKNIKGKKGARLFPASTAKGASGPTEGPGAKEETLAQKEEETMSEAKEVTETPRLADKAKEKAAEASSGIPSQAGVLTGAGNVDKIRDILFGAQMREYEKRFIRLEERMLKEFGILREDLKKRFDSMESYVRKEVELLNDRQRTEQNDRSTAIQEISKEFKDSATTLDKRIIALEDQHSKRARELHDQILAQSKSLSEEIQQKHEAMSAVLEREARELQSDKVDRSNLSELLMEMAMRLSNEGGLNLIKSGLLDE
jgi:hypothetical protein